MGYVRCDRIEGKWSLGQNLGDETEDRGCLQESERKAALVLPCLLLYELWSFGNLAGRGKLDLIISDKPLFPHPRELSRQWGRRMLGRVQAAFVKHE